MSNLRHTAWRRHVSLVASDFLALGTRYEQSRNRNSTIRTGNERRGKVVETVKPGTYLPIMRGGAMDGQLAFSRSILPLTEGLFRVFLTDHHAFF